MWRRFAVSVLTIAVFATVASATAQARVPFGFVGMLPPSTSVYRGLNLNQQMATMVASGVESLRYEIVWASAQPYSDFSQVPAAQRGQFESVDGVPTTFRATDPTVLLAAKHGLRILADVLVTPDWAAATHNPGTYNLPASNTTYARFLTALVQHYGPHGSFWRQHPSVHPVPIRLWQIWNEPNITLYWPDQPFAPGYIRMLSAAHGAIKRVDPGARIVLAGMPNFMWDDIESIYKIPGARKLFDAVAAHPFTSEAAGVITILQRVRAVMNKYGDSHKPLYATEVSWPSSVGKTSQLFGFETTEAGQAQRISQLLPLLAANRKPLGLAGFDWSTWVTRDERGDKSFEFAGLFKYPHRHLIAKPGYRAFRKAALALEGCRVKASLAGRCLRH
ncbi:MAG: hypothetical protein ACJ76X_04595 [Solirubrobacteraceae bacterium]